MVITQVVGSPRPWGGQELLSPPHTDAAAYQMLVPSAWGGAKSSKNIPGGWRKASQARLFYPHPHQCLNPGGCFWGCLPPPTPDLPVFLAVLRTGLGAPAARRPSAAVWLSAPWRFSALPVPPCLSSPAGFVSLLLMYLFSRGCLELTTVKSSQGWFWCCSGIKLGAGLPPHHHHPRPFGPGSGGSPVDAKGRSSLRGQTQLLPLEIGWKSRDSPADFCTFVPRSCKGEDAAA